MAFDGTTVLLGAPDAVGEDGATGLVAIYNWTGQAMELVTVLSPGAGYIGSGFGTSVAVDGSTIVVGAPFASIDGIATGAVLVYEMEDGQVADGEVLLPWNGAANQQFGYAVSISGTVILGGSPSDSTSGSQRGSVTVYSGGPGAWNPEASLESSQPVDDAAFGSSIDFDGSRAVIGEPSGATLAGIPDAGGVDVFNRSTAGAWTHDARLDPLEAEIGSDFGAAVAIDGDIVAIGAPLQFGEAGNYAVYLDDSAVGWTAQNRILPTDLEAFDRLGTSVGVSGATIYVGSPLGSGNDADSGCVHVISESGPAFSETERLVASAFIGGAPSEVGRSIAVSGTDILVGAPGFDGDRGLGLFYGEYRYWNAPGGGNWHDPASWIGSTIPDENTTVLFGVPGTFDVSVDKEALCNTLDAYAGDITFDFGFGNLIVAGDAGMIVGSTGDVNMDMLSGSFDLSGPLQIGPGDGTLGRLTMQDTAGFVGSSITLGEAGWGHITLGGLASLEATSMNVVTGGMTVGDSTTLVLSDASTTNLTLQSGDITLSGPDAAIQTSGSGVFVHPEGLLGGEGTISGDIINQGVVTGGISFGNDMVLKIIGDYDATSEDAEGVVYAGRTWTYWNGVFTGLINVVGTARLAGPMSIEIPFGMATPPAGSSLTLFGADFIEGEFTTYFVPGYDGSVYFDIETPVATRGGGDITAELDTLPIPFGFNTAVDGPIGAGDAISIKAFDVDGDLDDDVVVLVRDQLAAGSVAVYRNTNGTLCPLGHVLVGLDPTDMTVADLDDNGTADLIVTSRSLDQVRILLNDGAGGYSLTLDLDTQVDPSAVCVFNYNGDGKPDLAVVNEGSNTLQVFRNSTSFRALGFDPPSVHTTGLSPGGVRPGQVGGTSGKEDDIVVSNADGTVSFFDNDGGFAATGSSFGINGSPITGLAITDLDLDGTDDVFVVLSPSGAGILYGPVGGTPPDIIDLTGTGILVADLDLDGGDEDIIVPPGPPGLRGSQPIRIIRNDSDLQGGGEVVLADVSVGVGALATAGDIDGDAASDLIYVNGVPADQYTISVGTSNTTGAWTPGSCTCPGDATGDDSVDVDDVLAVLNQWGACSDCPADFNDDGFVNVDDLLFLLSAWGSEC
ncbi:MAG: hypothetical protein MK116_05580 [Phycisphaerales bacterium]|nr:hypothetical protein [Phycisphaerales bacterium]